MFILHYCSVVGCSVETVTDLSGKSIKKFDACRQNSSLSHEANKNVQVKQKKGFAISSNQ